MSMGEMLGARGVVDVDGNANSWDGLFWKLLSNSVVLKARLPPHDPWGGGGLVFIKKTPFSPSPFSCPHPPPFFFHFFRARTMPCVVLYVDTCLTVRWLWLWLCGDCTGGVSAPAVVLLADQAVETLRAR